MNRQFFIPGLPATKGSTKSFYNAKARTKSGKLGKVVTMADNNDDQKAWQTRVGFYARQSGAPFVSTAAVGLRITFLLPRPKGHYGTGRNEGVVKASAPAHPAVKPDVDKLTRAVLDGLTGVLYHDDAQVVHTDVRKTYTEKEPGAQIEVVYL
jgi:Holliday junction resolvase RusA-like endonuclease